MSEKYPTCAHISALVLFFVIRTVASFEVVPIWLNHTLPAVLAHLKAVFERRFLNGDARASHYSESSRCRRTAFLWAPFSILGTSKSRRELCRNCTEVVKNVQSCVSPKIAAQGSNKAVASYRGEEASHKSHTLDVFGSFCQRRSARKRVTVNRCAAIFKPPIPLLYLRYAHTFVHKGLLYHFNRLRTTLAEIQVKLDANSLVCSFRHFQL